MAYAAALTHHAYVLVLTHATWTAAASASIFLLSAVPAVWQWWSISLFLCRYDPADLFNEFVLVLYMVLVLGQSLTIQNCARCLVSQNQDDPCAIQEPDEQHNLHCTADGGNSGKADWPHLPFQCWLYALLSMAPRAIHLANHLRVVIDIQARGRRAAVLQAIELASVLPLWIAALFTDTAYYTMGIFSAVRLCLSLPPLLVISQPAPALANDLVGSSTAYLPSSLLAIAPTLHPLAPASTLHPPCIHPASTLHPLAMPLAGIGDRARLCSA